ncbi:MAG: cell division protein FtsL [Beijerinckiaceae bacterium]
MLRLLNVLAILGLIGTAAWAYSIKYETIYFAEQVKKMEKRLDKERDAVTVLRAEWQHINMPVRLQLLAEKQLQQDLQLHALQATQIVRAFDLPAKPKEADRIGVKIEELLTGSVPVQKPAPRGPVRPGG